MHNNKWVSFVKMRKQYKVGKKSRYGWENHRLLIICNWRRKKQPSQITKMHVFPNKIIIVCDNAIEIHESQTG